MATTPKVVVITGASAGIGKACADAFASAGYALALGARRLERLEDLRGSLLRLGAPEVLCLALDVCSAASTEAFATAVENRFAKVDLLLNNAGLAAGLSPVATGLDADWQAMIDTNIYGLLRVTRRFLTGMLRLGQGHIVNMGSVAGFHTYANGAVYAATKHAVRAITGALRLELNGTAIRISEIDPGMVETEFSMVRLQNEAKAKAVYSGMTPLSAADVADCVVFAASRPAHVNIDHILIMPTAQASIYKTHREPA